MKWQKLIKMDGMVEWICEHGVGHGSGVHGCCPDVCCKRDDFPGKIEDAQEYVKRLREEWKERDRKIREMQNEG